MSALRFVSGEEPLTLGDAKKIGPMQIRQVVGGPWHVRLNNASVVFEPSVYGGTGAEVRVGMVLRPSEEQLASIRLIEEKVRAQLGADTRWQSSIKESDGQYEAAFRPKVHKERVQILTEGKTRATWPSSWRGRTINAAVRFGGVYIQSQSCGPLWEVTHVQLQPEVEENPFA